MELFEAIFTRHSNGNVRSEELPRDLIGKLLDAGNQAPNHYKVRPWRFFVLTGNARNRLGQAMAASQLARNPDLPTETFDKTKKLPLRAPLIIAVGVDQPSESKVIEEENLSAAAASCQNILLAAHASGLSAIWRTGEWARDAKVKRFFGLAEEQKIAGFLYIGHPAEKAESVSRPSFADRTVWME